MKRYSLLLLAVSALYVSGCVQTTQLPAGSTATHSPFTHGNVQLTLKKDVTTQAEVLQTFGPPNVATVDATGNEVWSYQKNATFTSSTQGTTYGTVILFGGSSTATGLEQSSRTMTLIIKFDSSKKVIEFSSMTSSF